MWELVKIIGFAAAAIVFSAILGPSLLMSFNSMVTALFTVSGIPEGDHARENNRVGRKYRIALFTLAVLWSTNISVYWATDSQTCTVLFWVLGGTTVVIYPFGILRIRRAVLQSRESNAA